MKPTLRWLSTSPLVNRLFLGAIFTIAAGAKLTDPVRFSRQIEAFLGAPGLGQYDWLIPAAGAVAGAVITIEWLLGAAILSGWQLHRAANISVVVVSFFLLVKIIGTATGYLKECGCWGLLGDVSIIENAFILVVAAGLVRRLKKPSDSAQGALDNPSEPSAREKIGFGAVLMLGIGLFLVCQWWIPSWAALRVGSPLPKSLPFGEIDMQGRLALWVMDPNCTECLEKTDALNHLNNCYPALAITDATQGRLDEYRRDLAPQFAVEQVSSKLLKQLGLPRGSVALCNNGKLEKLVRLNRLDLVSDADKPTKSSHP